jgi:hypothetical protein
MSQLSRHSLRPVASGQHPSAVAKHDQPTGKLLDTGSVDRSGGLEVGVPIENLLDAGRFTARLEKLDRVFCNVGRHWPDSHGPRLRHPTNFRIDPKIIQLSVWQSRPPATAAGRRADRADRLDDQNIAAIEPRVQLAKTVGTAFNFDRTIDAEDGHAEIGSKTSMRFAEVSAHRLIGP